MKKRLKINGIIIVCATVIAVLFPRLFFRINPDNRLEAFLETFGFALIFLGQLVRVSARGYKSEHSEQSNELITDGPYQVVRNPMYLGILFIGFGVVLVAFQLWAAIIFVAVFMFRYTALMFKEEKILSERFKKQYSDYCKKVPRIFPSLLDIINLDVASYLPMKLAWFKKEIGSITTLLLVTVFIESLEEVLKEGIRAYAKECIWFLFTFVLFIGLVILLSKRTQKNENLSN